jgi:hypothetical protein
MFQKYMTIRYGAVQRSLFNVQDIKLLPISTSERKKKDSHIMKFNSAVTSFSGCRTNVYTAEQVKLQTRPTYCPCCTMRTDSWNSGPRKVIH